MPCPVLSCPVLSCLACQDDPCPYAGHTPGYIWPCIYTLVTLTLIGPNPEYRRPCILTRMSHCSYRNPDLNSSAPPVPLPLPSILPLASPTLASTPGPISACTPTLDLTANPGPNPNRTLTLTLTLALIQVPQGPTCVPSHYSQSFRLSCRNCFHAEFSPLLLLP